MISGFTPPPISLFPLSHAPQTGGGSAAGVAVSSSKAAAAASSASSITGGVPHADATAIQSTPVVGALAILDMITSVIPAAMTAWLLEGYTHSVRRGEREREAQTPQESPGSSPSL